MRTPRVSQIAAVVVFDYPAGSTEGPPGKADDGGSAGGDDAGADGTVSSTAGEFTVTAFHGSRGSAHGKITKSSSASTPTSSAAHPPIFAPTPPGRRRQIHPYMPRPPSVPAAGPRISAAPTPADRSRRAGARPSTSACRSLA